MQNILTVGPDSLFTRQVSSRFSTAIYDDDPRNSMALAKALKGISAILYTAAFDLPQKDDPQEANEQLLRASLGTYLLCDAARKNGVERIIMVSTLQCFETCDKTFLIDEMWRPRPTTESHILAPFLAEQCAREFAREGGINGVCLRFMPIGHDPEKETSLELASEAMQKAIELAFITPGYRWHVFHVANSPRYLMRDARNILGLDRKGIR